MTFWQGLSRGARVGLVSGTAAIVAVTAVVGYLLLRPDYQVLFSELTPQDAASMTAELDRLKVPYTVSDDAAGEGTTILVERNDVYRTRIKLMGKDLPLHGAVGFELFNASDFGMTEFAQKINFQRALQGELTRTILSLAEIRDARVLLALPEQGLFRQATSKPKASVTVSLKHGKALRPEQVGGIQRLVAAAVPGIAASDVTIVDQSGVALTRPAGDGDAESSSGRLDLKKDTEAYLSRKATEVLERALGPGQGVATVDVTLDMDRIQTTTEEVIAPPGRPGQAPTGVIVRERQSLRELGPPLASHAGDDAAAPQGGASQRELEYAVGRRVEQVVTQPGSIRRVQVVAVVKKQLDSAEADQLRHLVAASVGASADRGDTVVVQRLDEASATVASAEPAEATTGTPAATLHRAPHASRAPALPALLTGPGARLALAATVAALLWVVLRRRRPTRAAPRPSPAPLSELQRQAALAQIQAWMRGGDARRVNGANGGLS